MRAEGGGPRAGILVAAIFLLPLSASLQAQVRPRQGLGAQIPPALRRALQAARTIRFTGRRTVTLLKEGQTERHEEIVVRDGLRSRIEYAPGDPYAGQIVVEDGDRRLLYRPGAEEVRVQPPVREEGLQRLRALAKSGGLGVEAGDRIAGIATVEVTARDGSGNVLQRIAVDPDSGLVLRRRIYDATGVQVGGFVYTKVDLSPGAFDPALFRIDRKGVRTVTPWDAVRSIARKEGYQAVGLSDSTGFRLVQARMAKGPVFFQEYVGPGNGRLSLFQLRDRVNSALLQRKTERLHSVSWTSGGLTFVLLGPQDATTLNRLKAAVGSAP